MSNRKDLHGLLWSGFIRSSLQFASRPALEIGGAEITYEQLAARAKCIAATLQAYTSRDTAPLTAVFAYRSETAYAAVLGALMAGHGYVPLNRTFPVDRTRLMLQKSTCRSLVVDAGSEPQLETLLRGVLNPLVIICPDRADVAEIAGKFPLHRFIGADELAGADEWSVVNVAPDSIAYLLFTSGSSGEPKGVAVSHANALHYVEYVTTQYGFTSTDRVSQTFDLTFDLSVHDMFVIWGSGGCLCCATQKQTIKPDAYIKDARLSVWFSVPGTAMFMRRFGALKPDSYPDLRLSLFCGEALPVEVAREWALAAPNSVIENLYGPTELTIACTRYRWQSDNSPGECQRGIVPIGVPFPDMQALIVDEQLREVPDGKDGELLMTGPQLSLGYWQDEEKTRSAFVRLAGKQGTYYRTGDRVRRLGPNQPLVYLGRVDTQIKVLGHRVELGEIEAVIRRVSGVQGVIAVGWPVTDSGVEGIEVFLESECFDTADLNMQLRQSLPGYMLPRNIRFLDRFPTNTNGKCDRKRLEAILRSGLAQIEDRCALSLVA